MVNASPAALRNCGNTTEPEDEAYHKTGRPPLARTPAAKAQNCRQGGWRKGLLTRFAYPCRNGYAEP
ncbi:hypothetical protein IFHNHDMJ_00727 [Synechococcus sp. CBW1107]|nr:hypothetical protein IFHNHDMJ_00727 [Synechococcus sp. CBW1107]